MLDLVRQHVPEQDNPLKKNLNDTEVQTQSGQKRKREESPLPEEFQEDLIQLQDLLGDVFTDSSVNLTEHILLAMDQEISASVAPEMLRSNKNLDLPNIPTPIVSSTSPLKVSNITDPNYNKDGVLDIHDNSPDEILNTTPMPSPIPPHDQNCENPFCTCCVDCIIPQVDYGNIGTPSGYSEVSTDVPTPSSTASSRRKTLKTDRGKKRLVHKNNWITVQRKLKKNTGEQFLNKKGEKKRHWEFVIKYTNKIPKRRQTTEVTKHDRQNTFQYFLPDADKNAVVVCKTMFLNTISLSERVVSTAWKKYDGQSVVKEDKRGRYEHVKRVYNDDMVKSVCDHVRCLPIVEAHYVRKNSSKLYLESIESISRMYKLYCEWFDSSKYSSQARTKRQYREIVSLNFNLALHRPKKDRCDICHVFENKSSPTDEEKHVFSKHQVRKKKARDLKKADKGEAKTNRIVAATFDFQKVLVTPYGEVSVLYYKRRLATLNFTVYDLISNVGTCYMWHDGIAKRGSVEVSSCLLDFIKHHVERGVKEFRFWSDNCAGQNRNRIVFSLYLFVAKKFGVTVTHRFLEKGHTQNEGDSVHSTIERACRHKSIWVPEEWYCLARWAKSEGTPYIVKEIKQEEIFDFKTLLANKNWTKNTANQKVMWTTIREIKVNAEQFDRIEYKYDFDDEPKTIIVIRAGKRNQQRLANEFDLKRAYDGHLPISKDKYKDLTDLCRTGIIPDRFHRFYFNLPNTDAANLVNSQDDDDDSE
uniref:SFRICE_029026 n=1 Tax=Spodoptera frugiperda TaxID=7108 RepID=A0A2H1VXX2_SPOFR